MPRQVLQRLRSVGTLALGGYCLGNGSNPAMAWDLALWDDRGEMYNRELPPSGNRKVPRFGLRSVCSSGAMRTSLH